MARSNYPQMGESVSVSSRKIDGGYIVTESRSGPDGYSCRETFSATKPNVGVSAGSMDSSAARKMDLKKAVAVAKRK